MRPADSAANDDSQAGPSGQSEVRHACSYMMTPKKPASAACLATQRIRTAVTRVNS